ncbi:MAG: cyclic nucleotide-binding domain-containing protein [Pseudomonadota bacterium]|nr:cyclic nucleotide-binding domain-containing protein [Pseudomonadota bacterium]
MRIRKVATRQDVVREGDSPPRCCVVLEGYACTYRDVSDGARQILSFHVAGDMPDLHSLHLAHLHNSIGSIGSLTVGFIANVDLHRICRDYPRVAAALWRLTLIDASIYKEWQQCRRPRRANARPICFAKYTAG